MMFGMRFNWNRDVVKIAATLDNTAYISCRTHNLRIRIMCNNAYIKFVAVIYVSVHEPAAALLPGFAINW